MSRNLLTIKQFITKHPHQADSSLRLLIANQDKNGFNKVVRRIGARILLDESAYFEWVDELNGISHE